MAGELDVERMLRTHSARWFRQWEIYYELEPFGDLREDYRTASIVQMLYNVNRGKNQKALPIKDFLLSFEAKDDKPKQSWQQQFKMLQVLAASHANEGPGVPKTVEYTYPTPGAPASDPSPGVAAFEPSRERIDEYRNAHRRPGT